MRTRPPKNLDWPRVYAQHRRYHHIMEVARGPGINFRYVASGFDPATWLVWTERSLHDPHRGACAATSAG
jgi:hypothetical protein